MRSIFDISSISPEIFKSIVGNKDVLEYLNKNSSFKCCSDLEIAAYATGFLMLFYKDSTEYQPFLSTVFKSNIELALSADLIDILYNIYNNQSTPDFHNTIKQWVKQCACFCTLLEIITDITSEEPGEVEQMMDDQYEDEEVEEAKDNDLQIIKDSKQAQESIPFLAALFQQTSIQLILKYCFRQFPTKLSEDQLNEILPRTEELQAHSLGLLVNLLTNYSTFLSGIALGEAELIEALKISSNADTEKHLLTVISLCYRKNIFSLFNELMIETIVSIFKGCDVDMKCICLEIIGLACKKKHGKDINKVHNLLEN